MTGTLFDMDKTMHDSHRADVRHTRLEKAAAALIKDVRTRYRVPECEPLQCPFMRELEDALNV